MKKNSFVFIVLASISIWGLTACQRESHQAQGYVEGRYTYMATPVSGVLKEILVQRGTVVKAGAKLLTLELQPQSDAYQAALEQYQANLAAEDAIEANIAFAKKTYERYIILVKRNASQQSLLDEAKSRYDALLAQLSEAKANTQNAKAKLEEAEWNKNQKILSAPVDAIVFDVFYRLGEYTLANQAILSLLAPENIKAIFYVKENDLAKLQLGDRVSVNCDECKKNYPANISFISPTAEYTPPVIYSNETNVKLIFRIEARFDPKIAYHMHPGQPIYVNYYDSVRH